MFEFNSGRLNLGNSNYLACVFIWFANSTVNYVRLVALVDLMNINKWSTNDLKNNSTLIKEHCNTYLKEVIPDIHTWRNKVAAHFAATDPFHDDNLATLEMSVMQQVTYMEPYYRASALKWCIQGEEGTIPEWALTEEFEKLKKRYWPYLK